MPGKPAIPDNTSSYCSQVNVVDCFDQSPLSISILLIPDIQVTKTLLEAGADPNFKIRAKPPILSEAILSLNILKHIDVIRTLIDYGADVNARDEIKRETPLHKAATVGHTPVIVLLVAKGAKLSTKNVYGQTPLDIAKMRSLRRAIGVLTLLEERAIERELRDLEASHGRSLPP